MKVLRVRVVLSRNDWRSLQRLWDRRSFCALAFVPPRRHVICERISPWKPKAYASNVTHWVRLPCRLLRIGERKLSGPLKTTQ